MTRKLKSHTQCFETRPESAVEPVNLVTQDKSGLSFVKKTIFKNPIKLAENH